MTWMRFFSLILAALAGSWAKAAPITYRMTQSTNDDGAQLVAGYLTTDGTVGEGVELVVGATLLSYTFTMAEGGETLTLTPGNSRILLNNLCFDITANAIRIPDRPTKTGRLDQFFVRANGRSGFLSIFQASSPVAIMPQASVEASLDGTSQSLAQPLPFLLATAIPEPTALALAAMLGVCGMMQRRPYR